MQTSKDSEAFFSSSTMTINLDELLPKKKAGNITAQVQNSEATKQFTILWSNEYKKTGRGFHLHDLHSGFFLQQTALSISNIDTKKALLETSLKHYENFQRMKTDLSDIQYFVQWQIGILKEQLDYPWTQVKTALLKANYYQKRRGEAMRHIVQHYMNLSEWGLAYMYSTYGINHFYGKFSQQMKWFPEPSYYKWKILYDHVTICTKLNKNREAGAVFLSIEECCEGNPQDFSQEELKSISHYRHELKKDPPWYLP